MKKCLSFNVLISVALAVGLILLGRASSAFAHAEYESSTPAQDEVVATAPAQVDVYYAQEMSRQAGQYFLRVFNEQETQVSQGDGTIDDLNRKHMFTTLSTDPAPGRYIVRWKNLSDEDGEADEGAFCFYIGTQPTAAQQAACAALAGEEDGPTATALAATPTSVAPTATVQVAVTPTATPGETGSGSDDGDTPTGLIIVGVVAGAAVVLAVVGGVAIWLRRTLQ